MRSNQVIPNSIQHNFSIKKYNFEHESQVINISGPSVNNK